MAISISTENRLEYNFYPASSKQIQFRIKAANDAHIALTTGPVESDPMLEVFIGGWGNSRSIVRRNRTKPDVAEANTPDILSEEELRGFWIRWNDGEITVGREGETSAFLSYTDPEPFDIRYFGVCTGWGATGEWVIEDGGSHVGAPNPSAPPPPGDYEMGSTVWCDVSGSTMPPGAVIGGEDDEPLYVGRAEHEGALIPGKVKVSHGVCYVSWGGMEHAKTDYQVLCNCNAVWVPVSGNNIPPTALPGGQTEDGEPLFVGRVNHENSLTLGKVHPSHSCLYIPYGGQELSFNEYEVLTQ